MKYKIKKAKSGIYIKPENKGKFTATKKKTGKSTEELTHSKNPVTKKRAIFAQNAKKWKHKDGGSLEFLSSAIKTFREGGMADRKLERSGYKDLGPLFLKFLWVRDQAHVFHWQTKLNSHHVILGDFYEEYLEELDELAESIFGQTGHICSVGEGIIKLTDYSEQSVQSYLKEVTNIFTTEFPKYFPNTTENTGLYHVLGDLIEVINKLKYLMAQK